MAPPRTQAAVALGLAAAAALALALFLLRGSIEAQNELGRQADARLLAIEGQLQTIAGEVTRLRIEQRAEGKGAQALLEKLTTYAPLAASSRTAEPDFRMAKNEIEAVLRAFGSLGKDAYAAVMARFDQLEAKQFDELHQLLRAAVRTDPDQAKILLVKVLHGTVKPAPRLRWVAADLLTELDRPLAQQELRKIMLAESFRGVDPDRAVAYNLTILDPAAIATQGFNNFVVRYLRTQDPQAEDTLLQMLARDCHDLQTIKEMIEWLGQQKSVRAVARIEELYHKPPLLSEDPLFLNKCLDAIASIRGPAAREFLEAELPKARHELVQKHIAYLLKPM